MKNNIKLFFISLILILTLSSTLFAGDWVQEGMEWKYKDGEEFLTNTWKLINSNNEYNNYYFNDKSHMVTGLYKIDNNIHAFNKNGICLSNKKIRIDNVEYSTGNKGIVNDINSDMLTLNYGGEWQNNNGNYQFICNGVPVTNEWRIIPVGDTEYGYYYFDSLGNMVTEIQQINGKYHMFDKTGKANSHTNIYLYDGVSTESDEKGTLTYLPDDFSIEKYKQKTYEALNYEANEKAALAKIKEEGKDKGPKTTVTPIGEEVVKKEEESKKTQDSTYKMTLGEKGTAEITSEAGAKININFQYPVVSGTNSDMINKVLKDKLSTILRNYFEESYNNASKRSVLNLNSVDFVQIKDSYLIKFTFTGGSKRVVVYVNTKTFEIYAEN